MIIPKRRKRENLLPWIFVVCDICVIYGALVGIFWIRFESGYFSRILSAADYAVYFKTFNFVTLIFLFFMRFYGLYRFDQALTFFEEARCVVKAVGASILMLLAISFFVRGFSFSRTFLLMMGLAIACALVLSRYALSYSVFLFDKWRGSLRNILVIGCNEHSKKLALFYRRHPRLGSHVTGYLDDDVSTNQVFAGVPVVGRVSDLGQFLKKKHQIHEVVLAQGGVNPDEVVRIVCECEKEMVTFRWIADIVGLLASKMRVNYFSGVPVLSFRNTPLSDWENRFLKRLMDVVLSGLLLTLVSPIFIMIALVIRLTSKGPVFYKQERIGEDGRRFAIYKFRTMHRNAEKESGPVWAAAEDGRRTALGTFLRKNNLDELPQLWNVLRGDMSLVGPRPERPFFVKRFKEDIPRYMSRHMIRSGITGWAQVNGLRGNTSIEERTKFDLYYIENWSLWLDIRILLKTFWMTLAAKNRNAY